MVKVSGVPYDVAPEDITVSVSHATSMDIVP